MEALQIVRDNMLDPDDWIIDRFTIDLYFSLCECKDLGLCFVRGGLCERCEEIQYIDRNDIEWQLLYNAITCVCKM